LPRSNCLIEGRLKRASTRISSSKPSLVLGFLASFKLSINGFADKLGTLLFADKSVDPLGNARAQAHNRRFQLEWRTSHDRALSDIAYPVEHNNKRYRLLTE
jgi:hypothetical protein